MQMLITLQIYNIMHSWPKKARAPLPFFCGSGARSYAVWAAMGRLYIPPGILAWSMGNMAFTLCTL